MLVLDEVSAEAAAIMPRQVWVPEFKLRCVPLKLTHVHGNGTPHKLHP